MKTLNEILNQTYPFYSSHEYISKIAYDIWEKEGCPNGEEPIGEIKKKEIHWFLAKGIASVTHEKDCRDILLLE